MSCVYFPHVGPFLVHELTLPAAGSGKGIPSRGVVDPDVSQTTSLIGARLHMSVDDEVDDLFPSIPPLRSSMGCGPTSPPASVRHNGDD